MQPSQHSAPCIPAYPHGTFHRTPSPSSPSPASYLCPSHLVFHPVGNRPAENVGPCLALVPVPGSQPRLRRLRGKMPRPVAYPARTPPRPGYELYKEQGSPAFGRFSQSSRWVLFPFYPFLNHPTHKTNTHTTHLQWLTQVEKISHPSSLKL